MIKTEFTANWNGKLFNDNFGTVRMHNPGKYSIGDEHEIFLKSASMGIASIVSVRIIRYDQLNDALAYLDCGKPLQYLAGLLKKFYPDIKPETQLDHIIYKWKKRNVDVQGELILHWWTERYNDHKEQSNPQQELFAQ